MKGLVPAVLVSFLLPAAGFCNDVPFKDKAVDQALNQADPTYELAKDVIVGPGRTPDELRQEITSGPAYQYSGGESPKGVAANLSPHSWTLGAESYYYKYKEAIEVRDTGHFVGVFAGYTYKGWLPPAPAALDKWELGLESRIAWGQVDYDGALMDGTPYKIENINDYMVELRGTAGYDYPVGKAVVLTPYFGYGYRYLDDRGQKRDPAAYERQSNYFYSPIGLQTKLVMGMGWSLGLALEYDLFITGRQISHIGRDADPNENNSIRQSQDSGFGTRASFRLLHEGAIDLSIEPFVRYWSVDESDIKPETINGVPTGSGFVEPKNKTLEAGVRVGVGF